VLHLLCCEWVKAMRFSYVPCKPFENLPLEDNYLIRDKFPQQILIGIKTKRRARTTSGSDLPTKGGC
jgi:hypothetical protein